MEEYFFQSTPKNKPKMNYSMNNDEDTITVSIKNNSTDKISFFINKLEKIESKMETIMISLDNVLKYNKQLEDKVVILTNKLNEQPKKYINDHDNHDNDFDFLDFDDNKKDDYIFKAILNDNKIDNKNDSKNDNKNDDKKNKKKNNKLKKYLDIGSKNNLEELDIKNIKETITPIKDEHIEPKHKRKKNIVLKSNENVDTPLDTVQTYKEIKKELYSLDKDFVKECLAMNNIDGEIKIFDKIYIENVSKEFYPIRNFRKKMQYWSNDHMIEDPSGNFIKNTIVENIENLYLSINKYENYEDNTEQFFKNQEYINKLSEVKYRERFLSLIIDLIKI